MSSHVAVKKTGGYNLEGGTLLSDKIKLQIPGRQKLLLPHIYNFTAWHAGDACQYISLLTPFRRLKCQGLTYLRRP